MMISALRGEVPSVPRRPPDRTTTRAAPPGIWTSRWQSYRASAGRATKQLGSARVPRVVGPQGARRRSRDPPRRCPRKRPPPTRPPGSSPSMRGEPRGAVGTDTFSRRPRPRRDPSRRGAQNVVKKVRERRSVGSNPRCPRRPERQGSLRSPRPLLGPFAGRRASSWRARGAAQGARRTRRRPARTPTSPRGVDGVRGATSRSDDGARQAPGRLTAALSHRRPPRASSTDIADETARQLAGCRWRDRGGAERSRLVQPEALAFLRGVVDDRGGRGRGPPAVCTLPRDRTEPPAPIASARAPPTLTAAPPPPPPPPPSLSLLDRRQRCDAPWRARRARGSPRRGARRAPRVRGQRGRSARARGRGRRGTLSARPSTWRGARSPRRVAGLGVCRGRRAGRGRWGGGVLGQKSSSLPVSRRRSVGIVGSYGTTGGPLRIRPSPRTSPRASRGGRVAARARR